MGIPERCFFICIHIECFLEENTKWIRKSAWLALRKNVFETLKTNTEEQLRV